MAPSSGTRLGTYQIIGSLGAGGMGEVYRARDTRLGREVAVKVLSGAVTSSTDRLARLEREARTVAGLNHPNIVTLFSVEDEEGIRFLTMELVDGQSLDRLIPPGGFPLARVLELSIPMITVRGDLPRDLNRIITRCLEKNPRDRFQTARDVYNELRYIRRETHLGSAAVASGTPSAPGWIDLSIDGHNEPRFT